jgi:hypothetical protein
LSRVLDDGSADPLTEEIGEKRKGRGLGIDLDNLQLEDLDPAKYKK